MNPSAPATDRIVDILKTVAHPVRLGILAILCERQEHVTGLATRLGVSRGAVSGSLAILRMLQLVAVSRRGGHAVYRLHDEGLCDLIRWARRSIAAESSSGRVDAGAKGGDAAAG